MRYSDWILPGIPFRDFLPNCSSKWGLQCTETGHGYLCPNCYLGYLLITRCATSAVEITGICKSSVLREVRWILEPLILFTDFINWTQLSEETINNMNTRARIQHSYLNIESKTVCVLNAKRYTIEMYVNSQNYYWVLIWGKGLWIFAECLTEFLKILGKTPNNSLTCSDDFKLMFQ
jgi:predicted RNA-binding Zn-ribbon protein involved in translation (DUF1610 family)